jgi:elongation factor 1-gamma
VEVEKTEELERWFGYLESHLEGGKKGGGLWLVRDGVSEGPSLADVTVGAALVLGFKYWIDGEFRDRYQCIMKWFGRLLEVEEIREGFGDVTFLGKRKGLGCEVTS